MAELVRYQTDAAVDGLPVVIAQLFRAIAPAAVAGNIVFKRSITQDIGMEENAGIALRALIADRRYPERFARSDQPQPFAIAEQGIEIARPVDIAIEAVGREIGYTYKRMQSFLTGEPVECIYSQHKVIFY